MEDRDTTELEQRISRLRDEQLAEIAYARPEDGILEEAVIAAQAELDRRGIATNARDDLEAQVTAIRLVEAAKPDERLGLAGILFFLAFGPMFAISLGAAAVLYMRGYKKKSAEGLVCILFSVAIYGLIATLLALFV